MLIKKAMVIVIYVTICDHKIMSLTVCIIQIELPALILFIKFFYLVIFGFYNIT